jgi:hypothetical protein
MLQLSWWEQFIVSAAVSLLGLLASKLKNATELAALQAAISFLNSLLAGTVELTDAALAVRPKAG